MADPSKTASELGAKPTTWNPSKDDILRLGYTVDATSDGSFLLTLGGRSWRHDGYGMIGHAWSFTKISDLMAWLQERADEFEKAQRK